MDIVLGKGRQALFQAIFLCARKGSHCSLNFVFSTVKL